MRDKWFDAKNRITEKGRAMVRSINTANRTIALFTGGNFLIFCLIPTL
jgi:phosphoserine phosphatase